MLSTADNELLCRVEPGTPMNAAFKRYWLPAALISDFPTPDSDPRRVTLLCEDYVLFRDSNGDMACLRDRCCHRGASLALGRVEDCGVRCIFHGWQFDKNGKILDLPNSTDERLKERYRQPAFPTNEAGGMVWVYLGPKEEQPPFPNYHWLDYPEEQYFIQPVVFRANYTQVIDGGADSTHLTILHQDALRRGVDEENAGTRKRILADAAPEFDVEETEFGQFSVAIRKFENQETGEVEEFARLSAFIAPGTILVTGGRKGASGWGVIVPMTSEVSVFWIGNFNDEYRGDDAKNMLKFMSIDDESLEILGNARHNWHLPGKADVHNNWMQNREKMRSGESFAGLMLFLPEDIAVAESMGSIYDRTEENLVPQDIAVVKIRRILLDAARDVAAGKRPIGVRNPVDTAEIYTREAKLSPGQDWRDALIPDAFKKVSETA